MFSRILIPTDGSTASKEAMLAGIRFARQLGAELVGVFVAPQSRYPIYLDTTPPACLSDEEYRSSMQTVGDTFLADMRRTADESGVSYAGEIAFSDQTASAIVQAAEKHDCDLIFMGSHGQTGQQPLLGSVTFKVLSLSSVPVLVYRAPAAAHPAP